MYGKIFEQIYDGTLAENWQALITFQQMIVLCDADGIIDMTPNAISRRTGIPLEHIEEGINFLEKKDPYSRTPNEDGRRIARLDEHRPWGWYIVNHEKYKKMKDNDEIREQNRLRKQRQREKEQKCHAESRDVTPCHAESRHTDTDTNTTPQTPHGVSALSKKSKTQPPGQEAVEKPKIPFRRIIDYLNEKTGRQFHHARDGTKKHIRARWKEGFDHEDFFFDVIDEKCRQWQEDPKMSKFLRPDTLFGPKFEAYHNEIPD
jgi:uncharacterized phage protein (TIGR02220 family)